MLPLDLELPDDVGDDPIHLTLSLDLAGSSGQTVFVVHEGAAIVFTRETTLTGFTPVEIEGSLSLRDEGDGGALCFERASGESIALELGFFDIDDARALVAALVPLERAEPEPDELDDPAGDEPVEGHEVHEPEATDEQADPDESEEEDLAPPWEDDLDRIPCPDGACTGTLGPDGRCRYCGTRGDEVPGRVQSSNEDREPDESPIPAALHDHSDDDFGSDDADSGAEGDDGWDDRELCPDGSCTGTLGSDGRCRECGLAA